MTNKEQTLLLIDRINKLNLCEFAGKRIITMNKSPSATFTEDYDYFIDSFHARMTFLAERRKTYMIATEWISHFQELKNNLTPAFKLLDNRMAALGFNSDQISKVK